MLKEERLHQILLASAGMESLQNEARMYADKYKEPRIAEILLNFGKLLMTIAGHSVALSHMYGADPDKAFQECMEELEEMAAHKEGRKED
jgi:ribosomal protein L12E/L44/L45/RPP1/RPP2